MKKTRVFGYLVAVSLFGLILLTGCKDKEDGAGKKIILTGGFKSDEAFRIESESCTKTEIMVYLSNIKNIYENSYGETIWARKTPDGFTLDESVKETVLARVSKVKVLVLMASEKGIELSDEEKGRAVAAANTYFDSLSESDKSVLNADLETITGMYEDYALANKVYDSLTSDINPEISDDEARTITVKHILIRTYREGVDGERIPYSEASVKSARDRAEEALRQINGGMSFEEAVAAYNEDEKSEYDFRRIDVSDEYEAVAFSLSQDEVSGVTETEDGFYIIKCISTSKKDDTEKNKSDIIAEERRKYFESEYDSFLSSLTGNLNDEVMTKVTFESISGVTTSSFFENYEYYFEAD